MKRTVIIFVTLVGLLLAGSSAAAQGKWGADSVECLKYLSYYREYFKQKAYDDATPNWRKAYQYCPVTSSQNLLIEGTTLVRQLISNNAKNPKYVKALVDTLLTLQDQRAEYYPKYAVTALNNKGNYMATYLKNDSDRRFEGYEGIIEKIGNQTKSNILLFDLQTAIDLYQEGTIEAEQVINIYQRNISLLESAETSNAAEKEQNDKAANDMSSIFAGSKVATCDQLIDIFTPRLDEDASNLELATKIVKIMNITEGCTNNDLFLKAVTTMYKLSPSYNSAYYLYKLHSSRGNIEEASKYMEEAIADDGSDMLVDASWSYELALYCYKNGRTSKAYELCNTVINFDCSSELKAKAYFLIGNIWGSSSCGDDEISRRAPYWVACDYMTKAKQADPSLADEADSYIKQYKVYFPQAADAFMFGVTDGQSYDVVCKGLRAKTTVRTVK